MHTKKLMATAIVLAIAACDRADMPTSTPDVSPHMAAALGPLLSFRTPTPRSLPAHITLGSDGNMWFTESKLGASKIGRIDASGTITEFTAPTPDGQPTDITAGPDGALWFVEPSGFPSAIVRVSTSGKFNEIRVPCSPEGGCSIVPNGIATGPDGNLWITEGTRNAIIRMTTRGVATFFTIPTVGAQPTGITAGPDGALWFCEFNGNRIGRIDTSGNFSEFPGVTGSPDRITTGPDGNLWFTEPFPFDSKIGRITPSGTITEFQLAGSSQPRDIIAGPDGKLWFTEYGTGQLSTITTAGVVTQVQPVRGGPSGIGKSATGDIWLTQIDSSRVAKFTIAP